jgi:hypothetical protein
MALRFAGAHSSARAFNGTQCSVLFTRHNARREERKISRLLVRKENLVVTPSAIEKIPIEATLSEHEDGYSPHRGADLDPIRSGNWNRSPGRRRRRPRAGSMCMMHIIFII